MGQARLGLVGVVHADQRARLAGGPRAASARRSSEDHSPHAQGAPGGSAVLVPFAPPPMTTASALCHFMVRRPITPRTAGIRPAPRSFLTLPAGRIQCRYGPAAHPCGRRHRCRVRPNTIPDGGLMVQIARRDLLKGAAAVGRVAGAPPAGRPAHAQTTQKRELVVAQGGDIAFFDPHMSTSSNDIRVSFNLYDNLMSRHPDGKLYPGLATEWKLDGADHVDVQAPPRREVPQRRSVHVPPTSSAASSAPATQRKTRVSTMLTTIDRIEAPDAGTADHPHQEAGPAAAGAPGLLRRPDRPEEVRRGGGRRRLQPQAGGHRARCASCRGPRTTRSCSTPTPTTGAASPTSTA